MIKDFKYGFLNLNTRKFNSILNDILKTIIIFEDNYVFKVSRVLEKEPCHQSNLVDYCLNNSILNRMLRTDEINNRTFDCNFQQIKLNVDFSYLYYCLVFKNCIQVFKISHNNIRNISNFCNKQHKNNSDESQFYINNLNYSKHLDNPVHVIDYKEIFNILLTMEA